MSTPTRRDLLSVAGAVALGGVATHAVAKEPELLPTPTRCYRIGVISAAIDGRPQPTNGHTWHFANYFHPEVNMAAIRRFLDPGSSRGFERYLRNPSYSFDQLPFPDTRITHVYSNPADGLANYCQAFPGVQIARTLDELVDNVDAVWLGDASGRGDDHFELVAPALRRGLPTFCDKPIGGSVAENRRILELAREHDAPLMSASIFRYQHGMEHALRLRDTNDFGAIQFVLASMGSGYNRAGWYIYGQHPIWSVVTLLGAGIEAVSMYERQQTAHMLITYPDRCPAEVWYGRPDIVGRYCETTVYFSQREKMHQWTPAMEGDFSFGHHYEMFRMAHTFREMIRTRREPVPHDEILAVTAAVHAGVRSMENGGRLVRLDEVLRG